MDLNETYMYIHVIPDKKKVLKHHPDKRRARGVPVKEGEEDYFTCITRGTRNGPVVPWGIVIMFPYQFN